jgi:dephospho-CoA kinase
MKFYKNKLIGIAGTNGSGKDTLGHILVQNYGYMFISVTELLRQECRERHMIVDRHNLSKISTEWRRKYGLSILIDKAIAEFQGIGKDEYIGLAISSLRHPGEANAIHKLGGIVIWLDADPRVRYQRIQTNSMHRSHRADEDNKTYEQFIAAEEAEMYNDGDEAALNMSAVKERADILIDNSFEDTKQFSKHIKSILKL